MKLKFRAFFILIAVFTCAALHAEFVFKKDGAIIRGSIVREEPGYIAIRNQTGRVEVIKRNDVLRVLYTDLYMGKVYVRMTSGEVLEGYQVDEDRDNYTFRKNITRPEEFIIPRKKVMFIARTNPTDLAAEGSIENITIRWSPPFKPAKLYRVYTRENKKGEDFKKTGETPDLKFTLKGLKKNAAYEVYVTALSDSGEESLPSEKINAYTIPPAPRDIIIKEVYSDDRTMVTLTFKWEPVTDADSRVKQYTVYFIDGDERKKIGTTTGTDFTVKEFPAEGKHRFAVVAVNDLGAESNDLKGIYDAGYKIYTRISAIYLYPLGDFRVISTYGYGSLLGLTIGTKTYSAGIETGYLYFAGTETDIKKMVTIPILAMAEYRVPLFYKFILRPVIKAGTGYNMTEYLSHNTPDPAIPETRKGAVFNAMASAGAYIDFRVADNIELFSGAEYSAIFQKRGRMDFAGFTFGAAVIF